MPATWTIDGAQIFATGFSNGAGFVATRLLMVMPDVFAAFAVSGSGVLLKDEAITPAEKTPTKSLYIVVGTKDDRVFGPTQAGTLLTDFPKTAEEILATPYIQGIYGRWFSVLKIDPAV